jgi:hypothetical protein
LPSRRCSRDAVVVDEEEAPSTSTGGHRWMFFLPRQATRIAATKELTASRLDS